MNKYLLYAKPSNDAFMLVGKHNEEKQGGGVGGHGYLSNGSDRISLRV